MIFTCDIESDWGGRTDRLHGLNALPWLLGLLDRVRVRGIFFLNTEYLERYVAQARDIQAHGHLIGCHGHLHRSWRGVPWHEWRLDYLQAMTIIEKTFGLKRHEIPYRAPKFSWGSPSHLYTDPRRHTGLLRHLWLRKPFREVFYCHPFDVVAPPSPPPTLFTRIWYSRYQEARTLLAQLICSGRFVSVT